MSKNTDHNQKKQPGPNSIIIVTNTPKNIKWLSSGLQHENYTIKQELTISKDLIHELVKGEIRCIIFDDDKNYPASVKIRELLCHPAGYGVPLIALFGGANDYEIQATKKLAPTFTCPQNGVRGKGTHQQSTTLTSTSTYFRTA